MRAELLEHCLHTSMQALAVPICCPALSLQTPALLQLAKDAEKRAHLAVRAELDSLAFAVEEALLLQAAVLALVGVRSPCCACRCSVSLVSMSCLRTWCSSVEQ